MLRQYTLICHCEESCEIVILLNASGTLFSEAYWLSKEAVALKSLPSVVQSKPFAVQVAAQLVLLVAINQCCAWKVDHDLLIEILN